MRHLCALTALMVCAFAANSQLVIVKSIEKVPTPISVDQAVISPDGSCVVMSTNDDRNLIKLDLTTCQAGIVANNSSTHLLQFSADSQWIAYVEETTGTDFLRYKAAKTVNLATGKSATIQPASRDFNGLAVNGSRVMSIQGTQVNAAAFETSGTARRLAPAAAAPIAFIHYGELMLNRGGLTTTLNPNGFNDDSYLWPSISPDGTKVLYYLVGGGAFTCDLNGSNVTYIGDIRAPRWLDNGLIVGMRDSDNGYFYTSSKVIVANLSGVQQEISDSADIAMFPSASADGSKIAYTTPQGGLHVISLMR